METDKKPHVWVIEMRDGDKWLPCGSCRITREEAEASARGWNHSDKAGLEYRVRKYVRETRRGD